jgi:hypothetical protein
MTHKMALRRTPIGSNTPIAGSQIRLLILKRLCIQGTTNRKIACLELPVISLPSPLSPCPRFASCFVLWRHQVGRVIISQIIPSTAAKAGKPK